MLSISGKKEQHLAMFFCFSIPVLNQRAWFSGKPVPQFKKTKKKTKKKLLVVSYRKREKPQLLALILHIALFKNFLCQKKKRKEKKNKKMLKAGV